jgi:outer membrane protein W
MKIKSLLLVTALLCVSRAGMTQNLSFGPMAGLNISSLNNYENTTSKAGLIAGGFFNYSSKNWFGLKVEATYNGLGAKLTTPTETIRLNYIQVPILATYYLAGTNTQGSFRPKFFAGPHVNFLMNAKNKDGNDLNPNNTFYKSTELGLTLGLGFNYALMDKTWLNFDVRYGVGLTNAMKSPNVDITNNAFAVTLGVSFPIGNI